MWNWKPRSIILCLTFLTCFLHHGTALSRIDPLVDSKIGLIRGLKATDGDYSMFMGIPYATVNGSNPFGPAIPHPGFNGTFEAYDDSAICPQVEQFNNTIVGSLDCLHINVYVPNTANSRNLLPVLVWIHGGSFKRGFFGRYVYGPRYLVKQDIILVTLNYRVGPYGFMCLNTPDVPGNQGLKDQQLALRWVKDNIEAFGGDYNKITIFGQSAGSASVNLHLIYGQEKLFDKVIMHSGMGLCPWGVEEPDLLLPIKLANQLGLPTTDTKEALKFLTGSDPKLVIASTSELNAEFRPCLEIGHGNDKFIYDYPVNIKELNVGKLPILLGYTSDETLVQYEQQRPEDYAKLNVVYDMLLHYFNFKTEHLIDMETVIRQFYIGDEQISINVKEGLNEFNSDFYYIYPVIRTIKKYLNYGAKNMYHYAFFYDSARNYAKYRANISSPGAAHADEISYLFDVSYMKEIMSAEDQILIDRMTTMWANFVKYGNPTPKVDKLLPVQWPAVTKDKLSYLHIDSELTVRTRNFRDRMALWDLFYNINEKYQIGYRDPE